ncbi:MAG TPA: DNA polymerase III subunit delta [bacterium (Candidatus Stahlbacteria)]|nr:DNA polymerase III subunit delta [Candidatus Stahlbacteria bacterium]
MEVKYSALVKEIEASKLRNSYLLLGENDALKEELIKKIVDVAVDHKFEAFDKIVVHGDEPVDDLLEKIRTPPFGSKRRVVIIDRIHKLHNKQVKQILNWLSNPHDSSVLILVCPTSLKKSPDFISKIAKKSITCECWKFYPREASNWIKDYLMKCGVKIDRSGMELLQEISDNNFSLMRGELDKLLTFVGDRKQIMLQDVEKVAGIGVGSTIFDLQDAIGERDPHKALNVLESLLEWGEPPQRIFALIRKQLERLLMVQDLLNESPDVVSRKLGMSKSITRKYIKYAKSTTKAKLIEALSLLYEIELANRRGISRPHILLEELVYRLTT